VSSLLDPKDWILIVEFHRPLKESLEGFATFLGEFDYIVYVRCAAISL